VADRTEMKPSLAGLRHVVVRSQIHESYRMLSSRCSQVKGQEGFCSRISIILQPYLTTETLDCDYGILLCPELALRLVGSQTEQKMAAAIRHTHTHTHTEGLAPRLGQDDCVIGT
jgi:hypothetical protein